MLSGCHMGGEGGWNVNNKEKEGTNSHFNANNPEVTPQAHD